MARQNFFQELSRRHVFRVAVAYVIVSWLLLQLAAILFPAFGAPHWAIRLLFAFLVIGFLVALLLAWAFEITPEGVRRTEPAESEAARTQSQRRHVGRRIDFVIIAVLVAAVAVLLWQKFGTSSKPQAAVSQVAHAALAARTTSARAAAAAAVPAPHTAIPAKSIAVLPFANDSDDPNQRYFSDGLSEDLIIALSQYPELRVIGRESSFQLRHTKLDSKQIGEKLGVANLLEGSVSREGGEVRVRAELVDAADGSTLWSDFYDRPYKNLFALQDAITRAVAGALKAKLLGSKRPGAVVQTDRPPSGSLVAYNAYLKGNFYVNQNTGSGYRKAIAAYGQAIAADPKYASAYAGLSYAWSNLGGTYLGGTGQAQAYAKARAAADTALRLDPDSAAAYVASGWLALLSLDWRRASGAFRRALTLDPASSVAMRLASASLITVGRLHAAIRLGRKAIKANPLDARAYLDLGGDLASAGELNAAAQAIERAVALQPAAAAFHATLAQIEVLRDNPQAALAAAQAEPDPAWREWALALAYQAAGEKAQADQALKALIMKYANEAAYQIAEVYAYRGEPDQAFAWLDRAWRQRDGGIGTLLSDPFLLRYKNDPRFAAFCKKAGLPTPDELREQSSPNPGTGTL